MTLDEEIERLDKWAARVERDATDTVHLYRITYRNVLLYVGITTDVARRVRSHKRNSKWWLDGATITSEAYIGRANAAAAETNAIVNEKPLFNIDENPNWIGHSNARSIFCAAGGQ